MPKDYKNINSKKKAKSGIPGQLKPFISGLAVGLCVAVVVYFNEHNSGQQIEIVQPEVTIESSEPDIDVSNDTPPPSFDFYEILPNMVVNVSEWEADEDEDIEEQAKPNDEKSGIYILQIGSFKQYDAADEVKAKLALMGIIADIQRVVINGKDIRHRVRVGPYGDPEKLTMIRNQLTENNLSYMLLKLKKEN